MENVKLARCPIKSCSICSKDVGVQEAITERLMWGEPPQLISAFFNVNMQDLTLHPLGNLKLPDSFPFFENFQFLLRSARTVDCFRYLKATENQVATPRKNDDLVFCKVVSSLAGYFLTREGFVHFVDYINLCEEAIRLAEQFNLDELPISFFRSADRIKEVGESWLLGRPMCSQIKIYGNGAVTLGRIAREAFVQGPHLLTGSNFEFSEKAKIRWASQVFLAWFSHRVFFERTIPLWRKRLTNIKTGDLNMADADYFLLRITDAAILASKEAKQGEVSETLELQNRSFRDLKRELQGIAYKYSKRKLDGTKRRDWRSAINNRRSDLSKSESKVRDKRTVFSEEVSEVEIPWAIFAAVLRDRQETTSGLEDLWKKSLEMFEDRKPAPIVTRVSRDLIDIMNPHRRQVEGKEKRTNLEDTHHTDIDDLADTLPSQKAEIAAAEHLILEQLDQLENSICHTKRDHIIWRRKLVEGKTLENIAAELNMSKSRVDQLLKDLKQKARRILLNKSRS
jgi:hypothetical protein